MIMFFLPLKLQNNLKRSPCFTVSHTSIWVTWSTSTTIGFPPSTFCFVSINILSFSPTLSVFELTYISTTPFLWEGSKHYLSFYYPNLFLTFKKTIFFQLSFIQAYAIYFLLYSIVTKSNHQEVFSFCSFQTASILLFSKLSKHYEN